MAYYLTFIQQLHETMQKEGLDPTAWEIRSLSVVGSTNDYAKELLLWHPQVVILSTQQYSGRGRKNDKWESPEGGVWLSIGSRHPVALTELSTPVVAAAAEVLGQYVTCKIKPPNDIMVDDRKLAGILVEGEVSGSTLQQTVVGIGVNVVNELPPSIQDIATRLADHVDPPSVQQLAVQLSIPIIRLLLAQQPNDAGK